MRNPMPCVCLLFLLADQVRAQDAMPNVLTPQEVAHGWLLLFDGETTFGWQAGSVKPDRKPDVEVRDGQLVLKGTQTEVRWTTRLRHFEIHFEYRTEGSDTADFGVGTPARDKGPLPLYWAAGLNDAEGKQWGRATIRFAPDEHFFRIEPPGGRPLERKRKLEKQHGVAFLRFRPDFEKESTLFVRNIKLRPIGLVSLFDGKDLVGWREFAKKKSKFSVIDGAINVKDGPGDLQTVDKFGDFLLQLECISNGKHLNSGIFFRCRPDEYQNGYEAQIRNEFTKTPTQKYILEDYDPETHKLLAKKEAMFTAVDFGTGAIYRRQPARKEVAKDNEWFTLTVAAQGNHFATWVNGIQVADWIDNRPPSDNARTGFRREAGHISIQGHDPTTDLSFRDVRVVELKEK